MPSKIIYHSRNPHCGVSLPAYYYIMAGQQAGTRYSPSSQPLLAASYRNAWALLKPQLFPRHVDSDPQISSRSEARLCWRASLILRVQVSPVLRRLTWSHNTWEASTTEFWRHSFKTSNQSWHNRETSSQSQTPQIANQQGASLRENL